MRAAGLAGALERKLSEAVFSCADACGSFQGRGWMSTVTHSPELPGAIWERGSLWTGQRKPECDELCFSGSVSCLYSEGSGLDVLRFLLR